MATPAVKGPDSIESSLVLIRNQVIDAVKVIFDRAIERGPDAPDAPEITDKKTKLKPPLSDSGPLQDCEFGMILLLVRNWLGDDFFAKIDKATFGRVVNALITGTVTRVL